MLSYCLKCKKNTESINPSIKFQTQPMVKQCYYQNVLYADVKNQNLLKSNKQKDY